MLFWAGRTALILRYATYECLRMATLTCRPSYKVDEKRQENLK
jgi:hypothetical protein